jgi:pyruvate,water dikinase
VGDNPQTLLTGIGVMAKREPAKHHPDTTSPSLQEVQIPLKGIKRHVFLWVLKQTKHRIRDRENLRFERTRLFGRVRQIVVQLGNRLHTSQHLDASQDVFFLTIEETLGVYEKTTPFEALRQKCAQRKQTQSTFTTPPPDRFETRGPLASYSSFRPTESAQSIEAEANSSDPNQLSGTGACPGLVRGIVKVVTNPREATLREGEILVAQQTDPGWVVLFPAASGLLIERGSLLSHSAIVARELQIPCIVSINQVTTRLKTGDLVEMNGSTGVISILKSASLPEEQTQPPKAPRS